jgi:rubredoxin
MAGRCAIPVEGRKGRDRAGKHLNEWNECVVSEVIEYKSWVCLICGWIYHEEEGLPEEGIAAGTRFADIPDNWRCPLCDVSKADFTVVEF